VLPFNGNSGTSSRRSLPVLPDAMSPTDPSRGSLPSAHEREQRGTEPATLPTRELLGSGRSRLFRLGHASKADLWLVESGSRRFVVKDFRRKPWWVRWTGRALIAREARAYRWLGPTEGVPRFAGRVDAHALAVEYVEAIPLAFAPERTRDGMDKLLQLRAIVDRLHRAGLVHGDLRGRDNVLVDRAGRLWVVDLASAMRLRPGGLLHRALFSWVRQIDHAALLKWKRIVQAGPFTPEEQELFRRFRLLRPLWIHRRRAWRARTRPSG